MAPFIVEWTDYICPFCYVGLARANWLKERYGARVEYRAYDLHPEYPPEGIKRRAGSEALFRALDEAGLPYRRDLDFVPNSRKALMLAEYAREEDRHDAIHPRLFDAYWHRGLDLGDDDVLVAEAVAVGLDEHEARAALTDERWREEVQSDTDRALRLGIGGVPGWLIDMKLLIPGAQPEHLFAKVMDRLGHQPVTPVA